MTDINEYPLAVYKGGDLHAESIVVNDAEEEKVARDGGFIRHDASNAAKKKAEAK